LRGPLPKDRAAARSNLRNAITTRNLDFGIALAHQVSRTSVLIVEMAKARATTDSGRMHGIGTATKMLPEGTEHATADLGESSGLHVLRLLPGDA
jgi:hypothetical protein